MLPPWDNDFITDIGLKTITRQKGINKDDGHGNKLTPDNAGSLPLPSDD